MVAPNALLMEAYGGERGTSFTRHWWPTFENHLVGIVDASGESIAANVQGLDEGGPLNPFPYFDETDPIHSTSTLTYERKRRAMLKARNNKAFALFYSHIKDAGYRERLNAVVSMHMAQGVNARTGPMALACALEWFAHPNNAIQLQTQNVEWHSFSFHAIGISVSTPNLFYARMLTMNAERPPYQQLTPDPKRCNACLVGHGGHI